MNKRKLIAIVVNAAVVALLAFGIYKMRPRTGMLLAGGLWAAFVIYWGAEAKAYADAKIAESNKSRQFHQLLLNASMILLFVPVRGLNGFFIADQWFLAPIGLGVQALFFALAIWARRHLGKYWSGKVRIAAEHRLIRSGPYRFIRHPIYTAMIGMYAGIAIVNAQYHSLIALGIVIVAYWRKIGIEEAALQEAFGPDYEDYRQKSWALVPGVV